MARKSPTRGRYEYSAAPGSRISDADARRIAPVLRRLAAQNGGKLTAKIVRDAALHPRSPLHRFFEWDQKKAAERYQLQQAMLIIKCVRYKVSMGKEEVNIGVFHRVRNDGELPRAESGPGYVTLPTVIEHKTFTDGVLERALNDLKIFRSRYEMYTQVLGPLSPVFKAIGALEKTILKKKKKK